MIANKSINKLQSSIARVYACEPGTKQQAHVHLCINGITSITIIQCTLHMIANGSDVIFAGRLVQSFELNVDRLR